MMGRICIREHAPEGARFAAGCFDGQIGKRLPVKMHSRTVAEGTLVRAEIIDDGRAVLLTIDTDAAREIPVVNVPMSFGWTTKD